MIFAQLAVKPLNLVLDEGVLAVRNVLQELDVLDMIPEEILHGLFEIGQYLWWLFRAHGFSPPMRLVRI